MFIRIWSSSLSSCESFPKLVHPFLKSYTGSNDLVAGKKGETPKEFRFKILDWIGFDEQLPLL